MSGVLQMSRQAILKDSGNAISSPALGDGPLLCASPGGPERNLFGQEVVPVNRGASQMSGKAAERATKMNATYGRISRGSFSSENLQRSLESKLQERFAGAGLTERLAGWKRKVTPAGRRYCQLMPLAPSTNETESILWPTPAARDGKDISRSNAFLSQRKRHSPSMATRLLERGTPWRVITAIYCLAMGYPSKWNETRLKATAMRSSRKSRGNSSKRISK